MTRIAEMVWLDADEKERLLSLARRRNDPKIDVVRNRRVDLRQGDLEINVKGLQAEYAVAEFLGVAIDEQERLSGDAGIDLYYRGRTLQVKFNTHRKGDLYFNSPEEFKANIAVLVVPGFADTLLVVGWITRPQFLLQGTWKDWGYGPRLCVGRLALQPMCRLLQGKTTKDEPGLH